jgi:hypothetical protein
VNQDAITEITSDWSEAGIQLNPIEDATPDELNADCIDGPGDPADVCFYGGWVFAPDVSDTGEGIFSPQNSEDFGGWSSAQTDCAVDNTFEVTEPATCTTAGYVWTSSPPTAYATYQDLTGYTASDSQAPYLYVPNHLISPLEVSKSVTWTGPAPDSAFGPANPFANPIGALAPEFIKP